MNLHYHCLLFTNADWCSWRTFLVAQILFLIFSDVFPHAPMFSLVFRQSQSSEPHACYSAGPGCERQSSNDQHRRRDHHLWKHQSRTGKSQDSRTVSLSRLHSLSVKARETSLLKMKLTTKVMKLTAFYLLLSIINMHVMHKYVFLWLKMQAVTVLTNVRLVIWKIIIWVWSIWIYI